MSLISDPVVWVLVSYVFTLWMLWTHDRRIKALEARIRDAEGQL